jgi:hypothetical protein
MFSITCESCTAKLKVRNPALINQVLACPKCGSMIKILPPEDFANDVQDQASPTPDGKAARFRPVVSGAPKNIGDTDFAEIEQIIRDKESLDEAKKAAVPKPTNPASSRTAKPAAVAKPSANESASPLKPIKPDINPLAPRPKPTPPDASIEKPLLPGKEWTSPAALKRKKIMLIGVAIVAGLLLLGGATYVIIQSFSKDPSLAKSDPAAVAKKDLEKMAVVPKTEPSKKEEPPAKESAKESTEPAKMNDDSKQETNAQPPDLPTDDSQPPALPPVDAQPTMPADNSTADKTAESPDDKKKASPLAPPRLVDRLPDNPSIAPNTSNEPKLPFELLEDSELKSLFQQSGTSLAEIGELTNLDSVLETTEPAKFFVERTELTNKKSPAEIVAAKIPKLQYPGISPRRFVAEISKFANLPIALDAQDSIGHQLDLAKPAPFESAGPSLESILSEYFGKMKFEVAIQEWGLQVRPADALVPIAREFPLPKFPAATPEDHLDVVNGIKSMIAPTTWSPDQKTSIEVAGDKLLVTQFPSVLLDIERLLNKVDASLQLGETEIQNLPTALSTRAQQFAPKLSAKLDWKQSQALTLDEFAIQLQEQAGVELFFDWPTMVNEGWNHQTTLPLYFRPETVQVAINELTKALQVSFEYLDVKTVRLTTRSSSAATRDIEFYPIKDLLARGLKADAIIALLNQTVGRNVVNDRRAPITCTFYEKPKAVVVVAPQHIQRQVEAVLVRLRTR